MKIRNFPLLPIPDSKFLINDISLFLFRQRDYFTRMKHALLFAAFMIVAYTGFCRPGLSTFQDYDTTGLMDTNSVSASSIQDMLLTILNVTGLKSNFELKAADVPNIQASVYRRERRILYNPAYMNWISRATHNKWGAMALLAHEVGHHLNGHTLKKKGSTPAVELEADEFAGFVLYKLGASLKETQTVMFFIATTQASITHPARASRMEALERGWNKAAKL
jgi:hypothetical protein